jgi:hypothetical protein
MFHILPFNIINHLPSLLRSSAPSMASTMHCTLRSLGGHHALVFPSMRSLIPHLGGNMRSFCTTTPYAEETQIPFSKYQELDKQWRKDVNNLDDKWRKDLNVWRKANKQLSDQLRKESVNVERITV